MTLTPELLAEPEAHEKVPTNYRCPTEEDLKRPEFEMVWQEIKEWDISRHPEHRMYSGATGNHVMAILNALDSVIQSAKREAKLRKALEEHRRQHLAGSHYCKSCIKFLNEALAEDK